MKNETSNEKMANGQQSQDIQNAPAIKVQITVHGNSAPGIFPAMLPPFAARQGTDGCSNTIRGHHIGKAPPGRARAPGRARGHPPACRADRPAFRADRPANKEDRPAPPKRRTSEKAEAESPNHIFQFKQSNF
jgi:hypothetical protein